MAKRTRFSEKRKKNLKQKKNRNFAADGRGGGDLWSTDRVVPSRWVRKKQKTNSCEDAGAKKAVSQRLTAQLALAARRRRPVAAAIAVLLLAEHRVEFLRVVRVDRQQFVDHLPQGRVLPDPRVRVHIALLLRTGVWRGRNVKFDNRA